MKKKNPFPGQLPENYSLDQGKIQIFNPAGKKSATGLLTESNGVFHIDFFQSTYNDDYLQRKVRRDFGLERGTLQITFSLPGTGSEITLNYDPQHQNPGQRTIPKGTQYFSLDSDWVNCNARYLHTDFQAFFQRMIYGRCDGVGQNKPYSVFRLI